ncbi:hypothetical protein CLV58_12930 [Spirosoma oryzae]|uniref:Lipocalin-like protein n=1 Tax=Spirosoma oryzae TaxID=1469603 RepID=A0A2T0S541_9BACT|nr:hypothetical protein [Spirosoma oryzae]PRY28551.1 hypothetical protein CLV58_12930 [Spirosoma oryzae]
MKTIVKSVRPLLALFTFVLLFSACSPKSDPDPLDQYVGTWIETMLNGKPDTDDEITIAKSGTGLTISDLTSNDIKASISGSGFKADNKSISTGSSYTFSDNTKGILYIQNLTGSVTNGELTLKYSLYSESTTRRISVDFTEVFTKK